jgi:EAL domain-containing protein (putative c-di-GMP-specific phosphodiesterase class I)
MNRPQYVSDAIETSEAGLHVGTYGPYRLYSAYQPIYLRAECDLVLSGFEGLIRPRLHDEPVSPLDFFASIEPQDRLFAECMCRALHLRNFTQAERPEAKLFINLNPAIYESVSVVEREFRFMFSILEKYGLSPGQLVCEIIETEALEDAALVRLCAMLREAGCALAIDDFGTGRSGMARYHLLQPDLVKLDGTMFRDMAADRRRLKLLGKMVETFVRDEVAVLVEGIETPAHLDLAMELGSTYFQGYGLGKAMVLPHAFAAGLPVASSAPDLLASARR